MDSLKGSEKALAGVTSADKLLDRLYNRLLEEAKAKPSKRRKRKAKAKPYRDPKTGRFAKRPKRKHAKRPSKGSKRPKKPVRRNRPSKAKKRIRKPKKPSIKRHKGKKVKAKPIRKKKPIKRKKPTVKGKKGKAKPIKRKKPKAGKGKPKGKKGKAKPKKPSPKPRGGKGKVKPIRHKRHRRKLYPQGRQFALDAFNEFKKELHYLMYRKPFAQEFRDLVLGLFNSISLAVYVNFAMNVPFTMEANSEITDRDLDWLRNVVRWFSKHGSKAVNKTARQIGKMLNDTENWSAVAQDGDEIPF